MEVESAEQEQVRVHIRPGAETETTQQEVYDVVKVGTSSVLHGFNSTIFAYGQTGSGKTFTMYGPPTRAAEEQVPEHWVGGNYPRAGTTFREQ